MEKTLKKHAPAILCIIAVLALALPLITITAEAYGVSAESTLTGFDAIDNSSMTYFLIALPIVLGVSEYIEALKKYQPLLKKIIPILGIVMLILVISNCKSYAGDYWGVDVDMEIGFGSVLAFVSYTVLAIIGFKFSATANEAVKGSMNTDATAIIESLQSKAAQVSEHIAATVDSIKNDSAAANVQAKESSKVKGINDALSAIERLAAMKKDGILSEEEFNVTKEKLLNEI